MKKQQVKDRMEHTRIKRRISFKLNRLVFKHKRIGGIDYITIKDKFYVRYYKVSDLKDGIKQKQHFDLPIYIMEDETLKGPYIDNVIFHNDSKHILVGCQSFDKKKLITGLKRMLAAR